MRATALLFAARRSSGPAQSTLWDASRIKALLLLGLLLIGITQTAQAITLYTSPGVSNPSSPVYTTDPGLDPKHKAVAHTVEVFSVSSMTDTLFTTLQYQGFSPGDNWHLVVDQAIFDEEVTIELKEYNLFLNDAGNAFGQTIHLSYSPLDPYLLAPVPEGASATLHWLQIVNTSAQVNGYGNEIPGLDGFWQADNGQVNGGLASGPATGPYYDSNAEGFSLPPDFFDQPSFYSGPGTYLSFYLIPTWDIFIPADGENPAIEQIVVANYGVSWGFAIYAVPEPGTSILLLAGAGLLVVWHRRSQSR